MWHYCGQVAVTAAVQGTVLQCDDTLARLHGYDTADDITGANIHSIIPSLVLPASDQPAGGLNKVCTPRCSKT